MNVNVAGIYLAAGLSRRMGVPKLSIPLGKNKLGSLALKQAAVSRLSRIIVVTREPGVPEWFPDGEEGAGLLQRCYLAAEAQAGLGMSRSLQAGLQAAIQYDEAPGAVVVLLADQPLVQAGMIDNLIAAYESDLSLDYVASGDEGTAKPPVLLASSMFKALQGLRGDEGARKLLRKPGFRGLVLEQPDRRLFIDLDTPGDVLRFYKNGGCS